MASVSPDAASRVAGNSVALLAARLVSAVVVLATSPVLFAELGARTFGVWALLLGAGAVAGLADFGLGSPHVREVARAVAVGERWRWRRSRPRFARLAYARTRSPRRRRGCPAGCSRGLSPGGPGPPCPQRPAPPRRRLRIDALALPPRAALDGNQLMRPVALASVATAVVAGALGVALVLAGLGLAGLGIAAVSGSFCALSCSRPAGFAVERLDKVVPRYYVRRASLWRAGVGLLADLRAAGTPRSIHPDRGDYIRVLAHIRP